VNTLSICMSLCLLVIYPRCVFVFLIEIDLERLTLISFDMRIKKWLDLYISMVFFFNRKVCVSPCSFSMTCCMGGERAEKSVAFYICCDIFVWLFARHWLANNEWQCGVVAPSLLTLDLEKPADLHDRVVCNV